MAWLCGVNGLVVWGESSAIVIVHRTPPDRTANAIYADSGRNPIGQRTQMVTETTIWKQTNAHTNLANDAQQLNKSAAQASPLYSHAIRVPYGGQVRL